MDEPPAPTPQPVNDGPENAMLVEYEWRPLDGNGNNIPVMLSAVIYDLGERVDEDAPATRHSWHHEPAAENCSHNVEWENGHRIEHHEEAGWIIKGEG